MGHMDVVPVEDSTLDAWTYPPFDGTVAGGTIWGRGAIDVKFGVVSLMEAMEQLLADGMRPARDVYFAFGHDEEVGGAEGAAKVAEHFARQGTRFDFVLDEGGAVTVGMNRMVDAPVAVIGVVEKGYVNLVLSVDAAGGHSSSPPAQTALGVLSRAVVKLEDNQFPADLSNINRFLEYVGAYAPFTMRMLMANQWLFAPLIRRNMLADPGSAAAIRTTTAVTMARGSPKSNVLPTSASMVVNFRILPGETVDSVRQRVIGLIDDVRVQVTAEYGQDPSPVSPVNSRGFGLLASTIRALDGDVLVAPYMLQGGTDAKYFYRVSDHVYRFLMFTATPRSLRYAHGIDEQVPVDEYMRAIRFYYHLIRQSMGA